MSTLHTKLSHALKRKVEQLHPTLVCEFSDGAVFITGEDDPDMLIKEINEIVRCEFEGKIKDVNYIVPDRCTHQNYVAFDIVLETARVR